MLLGSPEHAVEVYRRKRRGRRIACARWRVRCDGARLQQDLDRSVVEGDNELAEIEREVRLIAPTFRLAWCASFDCFVYYEMVYDCARGRCGRFRLTHVGMVPQIRVLLRRPAGVLPDGGEWFARVHPRHPAVLVAIHRVVYRRWRDIERAAREARDRDAEVAQSADDERLAEAAWALRKESGHNVLGVEAGLDRAALGDTLKTDPGRRVRRRERELEARQRDRELERGGVL